MKNNKKFTYITLIILLIITGCANTPTEAKKYYTNKGNICPEIPEKFRWKSIDDNPRWRDALVASLLGSSDVSGFITDGALIHSPIYDWNGEALIEIKNQSNWTIRVVDEKTGCPIGMQEYGERRVFFKKRDDAPGYKVIQLMKKISTEK